MQTNNVAYTILGVIVFAIFTMSLFRSGEFFLGYYEINNGSILGESDISSKNGESVEVGSATPSEAKTYPHEVASYKVLAGRPIGDLSGSQEDSFILEWPVINGLGYVTQCFLKEDGSDGYKDEAGEHNGVDIAYYSFPDILAAAPGVVYFAGCLEGICPEEGAMKEGGTGLANTVIVKHSNGYYTVYGHLNSIYVKEGDPVQTGQVIAQMGKTGDIGGDVGVHLHFSLLEDISWKLLNPADYLSRDICINGEADLEANY